ncbi:MAG: hypothetical protein JXP73_07555 [Deltaproteobacteria bacterium]|nr:hypothetical protein [Deltaproteobacteria bacterium]
MATIASPETILRWYRELVARKYDGSERRGLGRPKKRGEIAELVVRMARENESWCYTRIKGALQNLGYKLGRNPSKRILQEHGIDSAPQRGRHMPWAKFIRSHLGALVGMDFFTVEVVTWLGLVRYHVLFAIDIASRKAEILGAAVNPGGGLAVFSASTTARLLELARMTAETEAIGFRHTTPAAWGRLFGGPGSRGQRSGAA